MTDGYRCERCGSKRVKISYPNIHCFACGNDVELIDYAISWDWHRHYSRQYQGSDPGPCYPKERVYQEEERKQPDIDRNGYRRIQQLENEVRQLRLDLGRIYEVLSPKEKAAARVREFREGHHLKVESKPKYGGLSFEKS